ncbi:multicopper oxidase domain-containing protein [Oricola sp.]|uniref:multicopper oxidase family protein n=1 Tax=Oricola sp. TaxID=1979950 RepID=UPI0025E27E3A|nr:multicopper oxidase domain-containing protein [Oricola sp.]MCI5076338.1 multicopper oxidase domain-containing protein [Oricola sp.]
MKLTRRTFLAGASAGLALPYLSKGASAAIGGQPLPIPPLVEASGSPIELEAIGGQTGFLDGATTASWGYSQSYLGPVLRLKRGEQAHIGVANRLSSPVTSHWHGMHVPAILDGGPQLEIAPGARWDIELPVDQPAATLWYHSHVHGITAEHVYGGLAGMIIVDDPEAPNAGLPQTYGVDDIPLVIQDRAFNADGSFAYVKRGPALMHGFRADTVVVNGAVRPQASVPKGLVRLRLLNGSNARIYHLRFADNRAFHQIASDAGFLPAPVRMDGITVAPAERVELLVDFSDGKAVTLLSGPDFNDPMAGMMGGMMGGMLPGPPAQAEEGRDGEFVVMRFSPDREKTAASQTIPTRLEGAPTAEFGESVRTREFVLNMHAGGMGGGMMGGGMGVMSINDASYDPDRIDIRLQRGETELWRIRADEMAHPFHVHGTAFKVLRLNGEDVPFETTGLKDVFLFQGEADLLVRLDHEATDAVPFMLHCHILEHEDAGMMAQFTVE